MKKNVLASIIIFILGCLCITGFFIYNNGYQNSSNDISEKIQLLENIVLNIGETKEIKVSDTINNEIFYSVENEEIAVVSSNGIVEGKKIGSTKITIKYKDLSKIIDVNVIDNSLKIVQILDGNLVMNEGEEKTLTISKNPEDLIIIWECDNNVISCDNGKVKALKEGTATVTVKCQNEKCTSTISVKVNKEKNVVAEEDIQIEKDHLNIYVNDSITINAKVLPDNAAYKEINYKSSNNSVATVDNNGKVIGISEGIAEIELSTTYKKLTKKVIVQVSSKQVESVDFPTWVSLDKSELTIKKGEKYTLKATLTPSNAKNTTLTWMSSDNNIVTVNNAGEITGIKEGTTTVTVLTANKKNAKCQVTVIELSDEKKEDILPESIVLDQKSVIINSLKTVTLKETIMPANTKDKTVKWTSSDPSVATVNNGVITGVKDGKATITAETINGKQARCDITVDTAKPTINYCKASVSSGYKTTYEISASDLSGISKYVHDGKEYTSNTFSVIKDSENDTVRVYDIAGNYSEILCEYSPIMKTNTAIINYDSDTLKYWIEKPNDNYRITHIWVKNAYNQLKTATTSKIGTLEKAETILTKEISAKGYSNKGMVAMNASGFIMSTATNDDYWNYNGYKNEKFSSRAPLIIVNGSVIRNFTNYELPPSLYPLYGLKSNGYLASYGFKGGSEYIENNKKVAQNVINDGVKYTFSFSPKLVGNYENLTVDKTTSSYTNNNVRQALCQIDRNNFVIVSNYPMVSDTNALTGKDRSNGFSLKALANLMVQLNCRTAYNLDGGGSLNLFYKTNNTKVNSVRSGNRLIFDILYFVE